ncbi:MFS transporter [Bradyrhizobium sp. BRP22]|uniref:MFS transporter n=1 Tax=Bradyrhizobium sp. BRP22 TaxID=2793821 RepID=UPI001CD5BB4E|nr:MFS transporter [Bradyrhizobium sp. BRP22]MCA1458385.1 MFS transporter [Bradyrhizobium sp. BRP22]
MASESQIPAAAQAEAKRFASRLGGFYGTMYGMLGTYLPFFPVWLKAVGIEASWIGIITAVPAVTRFTVLPLITGLAERRQMLRGAIMITAAATALGFALVGTQHQALPVFLVFVVTCCLWTPTGPLTDAYALRAVTHYGLNYGPLRLWGSAAFVVGALLCGLLVDTVAAEYLIWIIAAVAGVSALVSLRLRPLEVAKRPETAQRGGGTLLRDRGFLAIIATSALIQGSHVAYYIFASIAWKQAGLGGLTIAALWSLGVLAEIVLFAVSPRFTLPSAMLVVIGAVVAVARWVITALEPPLSILAIVQLTHGLTFGLTQVGIMGLLVHQVPGHVMARGQGYLAACAGIVSSGTSILCGLVYARYGQGVYYLMAAMAASGALIMWSARHYLHHPQSAASGG